MMNRELNFNVTRNDFRHVLICCRVALFLRVSYRGQVVEMNFSSVNFDKLMKIVFFCQLIHDTYHKDALLVMYCHTGIYFQEMKI